MLKLVRLGLLALAPLCLSIAAEGQQIPPSADTFTSSAKPTVNYGSFGYLTVGSGENTYIGFNFSSVPAGSVVTKATLRLYVDSVITGGQFNVYALSSSPAWTELTLNYNCAPLLGAEASSSSTAVSSASLNNFVQIDITPAVQNWLNNPSSNNGLALVLVGNKGLFSFDSKESIITSHEPELEIELEGVPGQPGPQGVAGPAGPAGAKERPVQLDLKARLA